MHCSTEHQSHQCQEASITVEVLPVYERIKYVLASLTCNACRTLAPLRDLHYDCVLCSPIDSAIFSTLHLMIAVRTRTELSQEAHFCQLPWPGWTVYWTCGRCYKRLQSVLFWMDPVNVPAKFEVRRTP